MNFSSNIIILVLVTLNIILIFLYSRKNMEHLTPQSDEAIQNLASLYQKDKIIIKELNVGNTVLKVNDKTGKTDLYIDGDIHAGNNIYMNPTVKENVFGSGAIVFNGQLIKSANIGHLGIFHWDNGNALFLARTDGQSFSTGWNAGLGPWQPHDTKLTKFKQGPET